ncbi:MAG: AMP-dependent synthetase and ligase [Chthoniobacteraceae bacterium]|nr:AMP-dependent synthetase and ligase [Chthoniobacteraceae bacterium]
MNIVDLIFSKADRGAVALIADGIELTYGELITRTDAASVSIAAAQAARIGLDCPNGIAHVVLALAIVRAGKCLVPIASELARPERARLIKETGIGAIVDAAGQVREIPLNGELGFDEKTLEALNPAFIRFSSGTTGRSKGIVLSHESLLARVTAANRGLGITQADRIVWILPMAHHFAVSIMLYLLHGATTIIVGSHLAEDVLGAGRIHGGTILYGAPFHHALLAGDASGLPWPSLRLAVSTAAALPLATAKAFESRFGLSLSQGLGVIEAGLPMLNLDAQKEKPASVGRPLPDFSVDIRDGEIFVRGPGMLDAYLTPWRTRDEILEKGWFRTGDLGRIDLDGHVFLEGRSHSVINVAGLKCFPEEIEAVLCAMPEVRLARVVGKTHSRVGAVPVAEIVPRDFTHPPKLSALVAHCRAALARYKVPVEFKIVESVPLTPSGKIRREETAPDLA